MSVMNQRHTKRVTKNRCEKDWMVESRCYRHIHEEKMFCSSSEKLSDNGEHSCHDSCLPDSHPPNYIDEGNLMLGILTEHVPHPACFVTIESEVSEQTVPEVDLKSTVIDDTSSTGLQEVPTCDIDHLDIPDLLPFFTPQDIPPSSPSRTPATITKTSSLNCNSPVLQKRYSLSQRTSNPLPISALPSPCSLSYSSALSEQCGSPTKSCGSSESNRPYNSLLIPSSTCSSYTSNSIGCSELSISSYHIQSCSCPLCLDCSTYTSTNFIPSSSYTLNYPESLLNCFEEEEMASSGFNSVPDIVFVSTAESDCVFSHSGESDHVCHYLCESDFVSSGGDESYYVFRGHDKWDYVFDGPNKTVSEFNGLYELDYVLNGMNGVDKLDHLSNVAEESNHIMLNGPDDLVLMFNGIEESNDVPVGQEETEDIDRPMNSCASSDHSVPLWSVEE